MIPEMPIIQKDDFELMQVQANAKKVLDALSKATIYDPQLDNKGNFIGNFSRAVGGATFQIADSVLLRSIPVTASSNALTINHGLGRVPVGFFVVKSNAPLTILEHPDNTNSRVNPDPTKTILLQATAGGAAITGVISLVVF